MVEKDSAMYPHNIHPMYDSTPIMGDSVKLRDKLSSDGYLLFRSVIDTVKLQNLRNQITSVLAELKWIAGGKIQNKAHLIGIAQREGEEGFLEALDRLVELEELYELAHDTNLSQVLRLVLGESFFPHPLSIIRLVFPSHPEITTPPHQDYPNNQGTVNLTASWIPLSDCSMAEGGLAILEGSHKAGLLPLKYHLGPGNRGAVLSEDLCKLRWVSTNFKLGDVLLFPSLTVHGALHNTHPDHMRLSVDFRHQPEGEGLTAKCLQPHFGRRSWEDIYSGWKSDKYKYYWKSHSYIEVPWDETLHSLEDETKFADAMRFEKARVDRLKERQSRKRVP